MTKPRLLLCASFAVLCAACGSSTSAATFPAGTVLVVVNRTETPVQMVPGTIAGCSEVAFDQPTIDLAVKEALNGNAPDHPRDAVDLTSLTVAPPAGSSGPAVVVITPSGARVSFGPLDRSALPTCSGEARPAS
jgi:hypothetical protein